MQAFIDFTVASIAALFPVVDPIGSVPIFLVLTAGLPPPCVTAMPCALGAMWFCC